MRCVGKFPAVGAGARFAILAVDHTSRVTFSPAAHVRILGGAFADECGSIRELICLQPEPCYRVELDASRVTLEVAQSSLDGL